ncbi:MAG: hypothetical protein WKF40_05675 [Thermoleophilaceae bacterium]
MEAVGGAGPAGDEEQPDSHLDRHGDLSLRNIHQNEDEGKPRTQATAPHAPARALVASTAMPTTM